MQNSSSYLMWIGAAHYPTIEAYVKEAVRQGVSKRVATAETGLSMVEPGSIVYLAHDEGQYKPCKACHGRLENPDRRKLDRALSKAEHELTMRKEVATDLRRKKRDAERDTAKWIRCSEGLERAAKLVENMATKVEQLTKDRNAAPKTIIGGTGGHVNLKSGEKWDYRCYAYWLHQPDKWSPSAIADVWDEKKGAFRKDITTCNKCGGHGRLPIGRVFGAFLPSGVEYILESGEDIEDLDMQGVETIESTDDEPKRGCGARAKGATYIVAAPKAGPGAMKTVVQSLHRRGVVDRRNVEITGRFAHFTKPVKIREKRFRGVKAWEPRGKTR